ncbi:MAG: helix-turn-helix transcriptional regulator [Candidatus Pacebacteria bacterium]|jgi:transcriptional regulator with XRE-family HTH domain|nr:helix-turn-helix transcriptional regulator [Candidatus Paceibacterota bacterium]MBT3512173.1 helix-turn-helix transcriptional regulator [Candidatus Paceibacterota bacterium]MBT4004900.1 helix-turn-helix transcriptional regulator [Candidatus Paceibacterota bacterium]MBT4358658.1 helix-turn-helix transcriptional regulator [Candidatus Paceibacterota bacterium]MBT4681347.1 helix-turn-helix transcriptional regulator [Candidatus Paceibacterota bacterium]
MNQLVFKVPLTKSDNSKLKDRLSKKISYNLRKFRQNRDLTQQELSDKAGLHLTYVGHLEAGKYHPSTYVLWKIANVLKVSLDDLVT